MLMERELWRWDAVVRCPLVVGPVSTEPPFTLDFDIEASTRHETSCCAQRLLLAVNLLRLPAVSVATGVWGALPTPSTPSGSAIERGRHPPDADDA
jgi:hypothetical protein